ncbi:small RNA 2'-O-methyltransferase-like [Lineus longissimus]|uniref:small RNA 2'-O-methyltransferase-like n=1 Tax=Lineus longissimus TaxID=88925 RepID=UPI002B4C8CE2
MEKCVENDVQTSTATDKSDQEDKEEKDPESAVFNPPLYLQRYRRVADVIRKYGCSSVIDFGTAECKFLQTLKNIECVENIAGVDVNRGGLESRKMVCRPMTADYLQPRKKPLRMRLFFGDLTKYDSRLEEFESVTLIEVIEHLTEPVLVAMPDAIFGKLNPKLVVITTPNAEYNVLFKNFTGKRHWDHKFEWNREDFKTWCENIAMKYNYIVEYQGIGAPPPGKEHIGCCSQMAVFESCLANQADEWCYGMDHSQRSSASGNPAEQFPYELISDWQHPFQKDTVSLEQKIIWEAEYVMSFLAREHQNEEQSLDENHMPIDLNHMLQFRKLKEYCDDINILRDVLQNSGYHLTSNKHSVLYKIYPDTDDEPEDEKPKRARSASIISGQFSDAEDDLTTPLLCEGLYAGLQACVESWDE